MKTRGFSIYFLSFVQLLCFLRQNEDVTYFYSAFKNRAIKSALHKA